MYVNNMKGRLFLGLTSAVGAIFLYKNYNMLPSWSDLKSRIFNRFLCEYSQKPVKDTEQNEATPPPDDLPRH